MDKLIAKFGDINIDNCINSENSNLRNLAEQNLSKLLEIILGAARIVVNIRDESASDGNKSNNLLDIKDNTIAFKGGDRGGVEGGVEERAEVGKVCDKYAVENKTFGPFTTIYPEVKSKNSYIFQSLFTDNIAAFEIQTQIDAYKYGDIPNQNLMQTINAGKSVVIFGFGFSGSGKTYTLIEGGKGDKDKSLLTQFIETYGNNIASVEFVEIYPENNTIYTGSNNTVISNNNNGIFNTNTYKTVGDAIKFVSDVKFDSITSGTINIAPVLKKLKSIEEERVKSLRILPTPNNPTSSRSFLQITIKMKKDHGGGGGGGQLVLFDMPGTENTVNIKKIMLGSEIFKMIKSYERDEQYFVLTNRDTIEKVADIHKNASRVPIDTINPKNNLKQGLCKTIFNIRWNFFYKIIFIIVYNTTFNTF